MLPEISPKENLRLCATASHSIFVLNTMKVQSKTANVFRPIWALSLLLLLQNASSISAAPAQYCAIDTKHNTDQCLVVSSHYNTSSQRIDLQMFLSAKFEARKGYAAFGTGSSMDDSLMFVIYPGEIEGEFL